MKTLKELRKALQEKKAGLATLKEKAFADAATQADKEALDAALDEIEAVNKEIERAVRLEAIESQKATQVDDEPAQRRVPARAKEELTGQQKVGLAVVKLLAAHQKGAKGSRAVLNEMDQDGYGEVAAEFEMGQKNMATSTNSAGGFAVPPTFNEEILGTLSPYSAFLRGRPTAQPMPNGNYRQSAMATRPTAGYRAEAAAITASTATLRDINMSAKLLSGLVPMSNQLINWTAGRASTAAMNELAKVMGLTMDEAMFRGNGTSPNPRGLFNIVGIGSFAAAAGTAPTQAVIDAEARKLLNPVESFPELQYGLAWVGTQRVKGHLADKLTAGGENYAYPEMRGPSPTFKNYPFLTTAQIPNNLGAGTNETQLALVSFSSVLLGESAGMTLSVSDEATYFNGTTFVSAFQNDLTLVKATMEHDVAIRYSEAVQLLTAVQWGA
jgi:HK97 family phage major capsid protein